MPKSEIITVSTGYGFEIGDFVSVPINSLGITKKFPVDMTFKITDVTSTTITIEDISWLSRLFYKYCGPAIRAWRLSDWMPEEYYEQKEWDEWERQALKCLK